jgi:hypothetical protein
LIRAIARRDQHRIDIGPRQQFPEIPVGRAVLVAVMRVCDPFDLLAHARLDITGRDVAHVLLRHHRRQHLLAPRADADATEYNPVARRHATATAKDVSRYDQRE